MNTPGWRIWMAMFMGLLLTTLLVVSSLAWNFNDQQDKFQLETRALQLQLSSHIQQTCAAISTLSTLFISDQYVDADQFRLQTRGMFQRWPFLNSAIFAPRIRPTERTNFEEQIRQQGFPGFNISSIASANSAFPVRFFEPFTPLTAKYLGLDLQTLPAFQAAAKLAISNNSAELVAGINDLGKQDLWLLRPLYSGQEQPQPGERQKLARGIVALSVNFIQLARQVEWQSDQLQINLIQNNHSSSLVNMNESQFEKPFEVTNILEIPYANSKLEIKISRGLDITSLLSAHLLIAVLIGFLASLVFFLLARHAIARSNADKSLKESYALLENRVQERTADLKHKNELLQCIDNLRKQFIHEADPFKLFPDLLDQLLDLTDSKYGLIGDVLIDTDGCRYLKAYALTNLAWDEATNRLYQNYSSKGFEFRKLDNLFGLVVTSGNFIISNDPANDIRGAGFPKGHPTINAFLGIPIYYGDQLVGEVGLANRPGGYTENIIRDIQPVTDALGQIIAARWDRETLKQTEEKLQALASTDPLTGAANRRQFNIQLNSLMMRALRYSESLSLLMVDIDFFKMINDVHGHEIGDHILVEVVELINGHIRNVDLLARWGGEEFIIILPQTSLKVATSLAERIRKQVENHTFSHSLHITVSLSAASLQQDDTIDTLFKRIDDALYKAKNSGRNCVVAAE